MLNLNNSLIIVDEAHTFISYMMNVQNKKAKLYEKFMNITGSRFMFLSGTPIINHPHEMAVALNILKGKMNGHPLFPPPNARSLFEKLYIDEKNNFMFKNRINGLVSFYSNKSAKEYPTEIHMHIQECAFGDIQASKYIQSRLKENEEIQRAQKNATLRKDKDEVESTYRVRSRQHSNFAIEIPNERVINITLHFKKSDNDDSDPLIFTFEQWEAIFNTLINKKYSLIDYLMEENVDLEEDRTDEIWTKYLANLFNDDADVFGQEGDAEYLTFIDTLIFAETNEDIVQCIDSKFKDIEQRSLFYSKTETGGADSITYMQYITINMFTIFSHKNIGKYSGKYYRLLDNIEEDAGNEGVILIYTSFITGCGIDIIELMLQAYGYKKTTGSGPAVNTGEKKYAVYTGNVEHADRKNIIEMMKRPENMRGDLCKILIISSAGAEGLDLKYVRQIHVLEPHWNSARTKQVIGRGVRRNSHYGMNPDEQNVYVYEYLTTLDPTNSVRSSGVDGYTESQISKYILKTVDCDLLASETDEDKIERLNTTDIYLRGVSQRKDKITCVFIKNSKEASIDCTLNYKENSRDPTYKIECHMYDAEDKILYFPEVDESQKDAEFLKTHKKVEYTSNITTFKEISNTKIRVEIISLANPILAVRSISVESTTIYIILVSPENEKIKNPIGYVHIHFLSPNSYNLHYYDISSLTDIDILNQAKHDPIMSKTFAEARLADAKQKNPTKVIRGTTVPPPINIAYIRPNEPRPLVVFKLKTQSKSRLLLKSLGTIKNNLDTEPKP